MEKRPVDRFFSANLAEAKEESYGNDKTGRASSNNNHAGFNDH